MRNRLYQESHIRTCQEIEELRRICCEETDRARQARIDELSTHQKRDATVSQLLTQNQDLQNKVNSLSDAREFYDPESGSSYAATPRSQSIFDYSESHNNALPRFGIVA